MCVGVRPTCLVVSPRLQNRARERPLISHPHPQNMCEFHLYLDVFTNEPRVRYLYHSWDARLIHVRPRQCVFPLSSLGPREMARKNITDRITILQLHWGLS